MHARRHLIALAATAALAALAACATPSEKTPMTFFVSSTNPGQGADLGGLTGADAHCQKLAEAAGSKGRTWHAYLSTNAANGGTVVNARDRIGTGPWQNAKGTVIATGVDDLHTNNQLNKQNSLSETGAIINGRGDTPNLHDVLTGSTPDGRATDSTCNNWTTSGAGSAIVGHHDRSGLDDSTGAKSWNASHPSRGCGLDALKTTGGGGYLYCFAVN